MAALQGPTTVLIPNGLPHNRLKSYTLHYGILFISLIIYKNVKLCVKKKDTRIPVNKAASNTISSLK